MPGFEHVYSLQALRDAMIRGVQRGSFRIVLTPISCREDQAVFDAAAELVLLAKNTVFFVDEIWRFCGPGWLSWPVKEMCFTGRHYGVSLLYTGQTPAIVAKHLLRVTTSHYLFRMTLGGDLDHMRKHAGVPENVLAQLPRLPDRHYFRRDQRLTWHRE